MVQFNDESSVTAPKANEVIVQMRMKDHKISTKSLSNNQKLHEKFIEVIKNLIKPKKTRKNPKDCPKNANFRLIYSLIALIIVSNIIVYIFLVKNFNQKISKLQNEISKEKTSVEVPNLDAVNIAGFDADIEIQPQPKKSNFFQFFQFFIKLNFLKFQ